MLTSTMVIDLQFGSTGKGSLVGYLAQQQDPDTTVSAWGPNAGHTFVDRFGNTFIHTMLPIAAVHPSVSNVLLGPASVIHWDNLVKEVTAMQVQLDRPRHFTLFVHPQSITLLPQHVAAERALVKIGSTMKGTGAAAMEKMQRDPDRLSPLTRDNLHTLLPHTERLAAMGVKVIVDETAYNEAVDRSAHMMIEGAQGYSLGLHRKFWPHTTSREIAPSQVLSDCALPVTKNMHVAGCLRTYPIRVANRYNDSGEQIGTSGAYYSDQREMTWDEVGQPTELTTVTKLPRRVFSFSYQQLHEAVRLCNPDTLFLNFANYLSGPDEVEQMAKDIDEAAPTAAYVRWLGYGPSVTDVRER